MLSIHWIATFPNKKEMVGQMGILLKKETGLLNRSVGEYAGS